MLILARGVPFAFENASSTPRARVRNQALVLQATLQHVITAFQERDVVWDIAIDAWCTSPADAESTRALGIIFSAKRTRSRHTSRAASTARAWAQSVAWARASTYDACFVIGLDVALFSPIDVMARVKLPSSVVFAAHPVVGFASRGILSVACMWLPGAAAVDRLARICEQGADEPMREMLFWNKTDPRGVNCLDTAEYPDGATPFFRVIRSAYSLDMVRKIVGTDDEEEQQHQSAPPPSAPTPSRKVRSSSGAKTTKKRSQDSLSQPKRKHSKGSSKRRGRAKDRR